MCVVVVGPLPKTVVDFWRLVWQEKPLTIVMVTNLKEGNNIKCEQYWPEFGTKNFGPFQVTISNEETLADYTTRTLLVKVSCVVYLWALRTHQLLALIDSFIPNTSPGGRVCVLT